MLIYQQTKKEKERKENLIATKAIDNKSKSDLVNQQMTMAKHKIKALKALQIEDDKQIKVQHEMIGMLNDALKRGATIVKEVKHKKKAAVEVEPEEEKEKERI